MAELQLPPVTVFCVDDLNIICSTLQDVLNLTPGYRCVGYALTPDEALSPMIALRPQVAIIDLIYVQGSGFVLLDQMRLHLPATRVIVYSALDDATCAKRSLQQGAVGYVSKNESIAALLSVLHDVSGGSTTVSPQIAARFLKGYMAPGGGEDALARLTAVELSIFLMLGQALSTAEIAHRLCKSTKTIEAHKRQARQKLGIDNGAALHQSATRYLAEIG